MTTTPISAGTQTPLPKRVARYVREHGVISTARRAAEATSDNIVPRVYVDESHVWMELDLQEERPATPLPSGVDLMAGHAGMLGLLDALPTIGAAAAQRRLDEGVRWFVAVEGGAPLFSCWVFHHRVPAIAAPGGALAMPERVGFLEDSVTSPAARGRGIAPSAWAEVSDRLRQAGDTWLLTKVATSNNASLRACHKAGFRDIGVVHYARLGPRRRVAFNPEPGAANATWLAAGLHATRS